MTVHTVTHKAIAGTIFTTPSTYIYISGDVSHLIFNSDGVTYFETILGYVSIDDLQDSVDHNYSTFNSYLTTRKN